MSTRRQFLTGVGRAGGYGAAYLMMQSLGLLPVAASSASELKLSSDTGLGKKVIVLGAGIAGLVSAFELRKAGFRCTVLEASSRPGGRNWTIRAGSRVELSDGTAQTCSFQPSSYFNAGPGRLPSEHFTILKYCHDLGVPLEVEINSSRSSLLQSDNLNGGKAVEQRQIVNDTRGHVAELLAKCVRQGFLDQELSAADHERMLEFLRAYGDLSPDFFYKGSTRAGYKQMPGAGLQSGEARDPLDMHALLNANLWQSMLFDEQFDMQPTMFQPVGGMDRIPAAFEKRLRDVIHYDSPVSQIRKTATGVRVVCKSSRGTYTTHEADYCICSIPLSILKDIDTDFSPDMQSAIRSATYAAAYKIAWESRRFWEQDYAIYGGLSFPKQKVGVVWYPSGGLFSEKGVIVSGYGMEDRDGLSQMSLEEKLAASRHAIECLHPGHSKELTKPMYVSWKKVPHQLGSWASFGHSREISDSYRRLIEPDGPVYLAGDHVSRIVAWQEGAALSAHRAVAMIAAKCGKDVAPTKEAQVTA